MSTRAKTRAKAPEPKEKTIDDWLAILGLLGLGLVLIGWGIVNGWNSLLIVFGLIFSGSSILGTPEIRMYLKLSVNRISGKEVFHFQEVHHSTFYQGGFHYHEAPATEKSRTERVPQPQAPQAEWVVDEGFQLGGGDYREFDFELDEGDHLTGQVEADGEVSAYLVTPHSLRSLLHGRGFTSYWGAEDVTRTRVVFDCLESRKFAFVVGNRDEDEDNFISVDVKLQVRPVDPLDLDPTISGL